MKKSELGKLKVMIADRSPVFRYGLETYLGNVQGLEVAGWAQEAAGMVPLVASVAPQVLLVEAVMVAEEGFRLVKVLRATVPGLQVVLVSGSQEIHWLLRGLRAGAAGVLSPYSPLSEIGEALERIRAGRPHIPAGLAEQMIIQYQRNEAEPMEDRLSPREFEVMKLITRGLKLSEIASELGISHQTVTTHRRHILEKTGLRTTGEIIRLGLQRGIL